MKEKWISGLAIRGKRFKAIIVPEEDVKESMRSSKEVLDSGNTPDNVIVQLEDTDKKYRDVWFKDHRVQNEIGEN